MANCWGCISPVASTSTIRHCRFPCAQLLQRSALQWRLKNRAHNVYMGIIKVHKEAQKTDAFQRNGNLILDGTAPLTASPRPGDRGRSMCAAPMLLPPPRWRMSTSST
ncbi:MAG: SufD family Fe-S cluster assembly protein [Caldilineaceae bacterium]